ncbi:MAG: TipAS antibiotic-recognition domain-containing protein, partial [Clostridia bacterium]|nr:TipAS antibiotic-recognition domain-containing protein [Clostridia bacterium]
MKNYDLEVKERFCETEVYSEYANKTANYTSENWQNVTEGLNAIFNKFAVCMQNGYTAQSANAQELVKELQLFITEKFYTCTDKILSGLSQIYVADER